MSFRNRSSLLVASIATALPLDDVFSGSYEMPWNYIVSTRRERHAKHPRMIRHTSRAKSRKRNRNKIKRRSHGG